MNNSESIGKGNTWKKEVGDQRKKAAIARNRRSIDVVDTMTRSLLSLGSWITFRLKLILFSLVSFTLTHSFTISLPVLFHKNASNTKKCHANKRWGTSLSSHDWTPFLSNFSPPFTLRSSTPVSQVIRLRQGLCKSCKNIGSWRWSQVYTLPSKVFEKKVNESDLTSLISSFRPSPSFLSFHHHHLSQSLSSSFILSFLPSSPFLVNKAINLESDAFSTCHKYWRWQRYKKEVKNKPLNLNRMISLYLDSIGK